MNKHANDVARGMRRSHPVSGEIYNWEELGSELGSSFRSDGEVILSEYQRGLDEMEFLWSLPTG